MVRPVHHDGLPGASPASNLTTHTGHRLVSSVALMLLAFCAPALRAADVAARALLLDTALAGDVVVAVGERGTILRSSDAARDWREAKSPTKATLTAVTFADSRRGWAVGHDALLLATNDGGETWSKQWQGESLADSFLDVLAIDGSHILAVGAYGLCIESKDGGATWNRRKLLEEDYHLNRISRGPSGSLYLAGEHGTLLRSTDAGATWTPIPTSYEGSFFGVLPLEPQTLLAHGLRGRVFRSADDGKTWTAVPISEPVLLASAVRLKSGAVVLAGQARALLVSNDGGASFTRREVGVTTGIAEVIELRDGSLLAVGEAGASRIEASHLSTPPASPAGSAAEPRR